MTWISIYTGRCTRTARLANHFAAYTREDGLDDALRQFFPDCQKINGGNSLPVKVGIYSTRMGNAPISAACGRVNLYDLAVIANEDKNAFQNLFNTLPMGILESMFKMNYKLLIKGEERPVTLKIAPIKDGAGEKPVMGVRAWKLRK